MVRILLVVTVVALFGGGFIAMNKVQGRIGNLSTDLANTQNTLSDTERKLETAKKAQIAAAGKMADAQREADNAKTRLSKAVSDLVDQRQRADGTKPTRTSSRPNLLTQGSSVNLGDCSSRPTARRHKSGKSWPPSPTSTTNALISLLKT